MCPALCVMQNGRFHILDYGLWRDAASPEERSLAGPNVRVAAEFWFVDVDEADGGWVA
jgi:hypothetical protein